MPRVVVDERFLLHRLHSTSLAAMAGGAMVGGDFLWRGYAQHQWRWDLLAVLVVMATVKWAAMLYYHLTD